VGQPLDLSTFNFDTLSSYGNQDWASLFSENVPIGNMDFKSVSDLQTVIPILMAQQPGTVFALAKMLKNGKIQSVQLSKWMESNVKQDPGNWMPGLKNKQKKTETPAQQTKDDKVKVEKELEQLNDPSVNQFKENAKEWIEPESMWENDKTNFNQWVESTDNWEINNEKDAKILSNEQLESNESDETEEASTKIMAGDWSASSGLGAIIEDDAKWEIDSETAQPKMGNKREISLTGHSPQGPKDDRISILRGGLLNNSGDNEATSRGVDLGALNRRNWNTDNTWNIDCVACIANVGILDDQCASCFNINSQDWDEDADNWRDDMASLRRGFYAAVPWAKAKEFTAAFEFRPIYEEIISRPRVLTCLTERQNWVDDECLFVSTNWYKLHARKNFNYCLTRPDFYTNQMQGLSQDPSSLKENCRAIQMKEMRTLYSDCIVSKSGVRKDLTGELDCDVMKAVSIGGSTLSDVQKLNANAHFEACYNFAIDSSNKKSVLREAQIKEYANFSDKFMRAGSLKPTLSMITVDCVRTALLKSGCTDDASD
jgi:hypothetical protein